MHLRQVCRDIHVSKQPPKYSNLRKAYIYSNAIVYANPFMKSFLEIEVKCNIWNKTGYYYGHHNRHFSFYPDVFSCNMNNIATRRACWIHDECHFVQPSWRDSISLPLFKLESIILTEFNLITYIQKNHRQSIISNDYLFIYRN